MSLGTRFYYAPALGRRRRLTRVHKPSLCSPQGATLRRLVCPPSLPELNRPPSFTIPFCWRQLSSLIADVPKHFASPMHACHHGRYAEFFHLLSGSDRNLLD